MLEIQANSVLEEEPILFFFSTEHLISSVVASTNLVVKWWSTFPKVVKMVCI